MSEPRTPVTFKSLNLPHTLLTALASVGYETPSPIQIQAIPRLLDGQDLLGNAPTGTGKTAAFALPLISRVDITRPQVQILTLTPTRELALQVAEAFQTYAAGIKGFHVLPIYGGQDYGPQLQRLKRGVHAVVGTPGRIRDHLQRGTLKLDSLQAVVLDEADEMLRMGFIDEVEWILQQTPKTRQMALFSATMPKAVQSIARRYMRDPYEISIQAKTATAETIRQRFWLVGGLKKLDALTRILEVEPIDGVLIFVRTKTATSELADRLEARGYSAAAMNGDMPQRQREQTVDRLKSGTLDILIATDVAARGLDVDRISHVINYDIPYDTEAYIHRIGRTGRAGRAGEAILFVAPRERRMLNTIERATRQKIEPLKLPTTETVNNKRVADFKQKITDTLAAGELSFMQNLVEQYQQEHDVPALEIASALAQLAIGDVPLLLSHDKAGAFRSSDARSERASGPEARPRKERRSRLDFDFETFRVEVGNEHGAKPGNIVGALANEAGIGSDAIGRVIIQDSYSTVELPEGMPDELYRDLQKVWVCGQMLKISRVDDPSSLPVGDATRPVQKRKRVPSSGTHQQQKTADAKNLKIGKRKNKKDKAGKKDKRRGSKHAK
ncbi:MAG: DEAD/DEAH box helicase [Pseudomonadales bacterium]|jgi:ATP-dependent RNA helicase DeaD|nr:DEAD/DEAH box helicase [Pseudomonadales bacterium]